MAQLLRPISTITDQGNFTGPSAHGSVDGTAPDTGDYWNGNDNQTDIFEVLLTDLSASEPAAGTATVSIYETVSDTDVAPASGGATPTFDLEVYEGATQRAVTTGVTPTDSAFTLNNSLTFAAADITDWSDVRVRLTSNGTGGSPGGRRGVATSYIEISAPDAGGTTFFQTNTGAVTPTGDVTVKDILKSVAGALTPTGDVTVKDIFKLVAGAVTPTGALIKDMLKNLAGSVTPTGALVSVKTFTQAVAGAVAPAGALVKETLKGVAGSLTPTGDITVKDIFKNVAGVLTPTGALATAATFLQTVAGALVPTGVLATMFIPDGGGPVAIIYRRYSSIMQQTLTGRGSRRR